VQQSQATVKMCDLNRFYQDFAGYKDMKGKQVAALDEFIEEKDINLLTREQKMALVQKIMASM
jgi:hypothetical protein